MDAGQRSTQRSIIETTHLAVRVTPRSGHDALAGWQNGVLRVRLAAAPVDGRANESLVRFLARLAGLPAGRVRITNGARSREKRVAFDGIAPALLWERLGISGDAGPS